MSLTRKKGEKGVQNRKNSDLFRKKENGSERIRTEGIRWGVDVKVLSIHSGNVALEIVSDKKKIAVNLKEGEGATVTCVDNVIKFFRVTEKNEAHLLKEEKKELTPEDQMELNKLLLESVKDGKILKVTEALDKGADVNVRENGDTVLMLAIWKANVSMVKLLLRRGADVNIKNHSKWTALTMAEQTGQEDIADLLKEHGAK